MADSQRQVEIINRKVEEFQEDSQALHDALTSYVEYVSSSCKMSIQSKGMGGLSYRDIRNVLHDSHELVLDFLERLKCSPEVDKTDQTQTRGSSTSRDMSTSSSSLPSSSSSSNIARPESSLSNHFLLKLQDRLETVEKEMTHVVEMKEEMNGLKEGMNKVKEEMGNFGDGIKGLKDAMKKVKKTNKDVQGQLGNMQERVGACEEAKTDLEELSEHFTQLSENYNENKAKNHGWLRKFEDKMYTHEQSCLSVTSNLQAEIDGLSEKMVNAENRMGEMEKEKEGEDVKGKLLEERVKELEKNHGKIEVGLIEMKKEEETKSVNLKMLEEKMEEVEKDHDKLELMEERVEELEGDMRDVQRIKLEEIEEKISRLEEEKADQEKQKMLEDRAMEEYRRKKIEHTGDVKSKLKRCVSSFDAIDKRRQLQVAVYVRLSGAALKLQRHTAVTCFTDVITNKGDHYDPCSRMFTAPADGVYMTSLVHTQGGKDGVKLTLYHVVANPGPGGVKEKKVCVTKTNVENTSCTDVGVVWMSEGDRLYAKVGSCGNVMKICWPSSFSCNLTG